MITFINICHLLSLHRQLYVVASGYLLVWYVYYCYSINIFVKAINHSIIDTIGNWILLVNILCVTEACWSIPFFQVFVRFKNYVSLCAIISGNHFYIYCWFVLLLFCKTILCPQISLIFYYDFNGGIIQLRYWHYYFLLFSSKED